MDGCSRAQDHGLLRGRVGEAVLVPARTGRGVGLFLVRPGDAVLHAVPTSTGEPAAALVLDDTPAELVGDQDGAAFGALRLLSIAAITASASGVLAGALELTTEYVRTRRQFDRALAEFQAVTVQIADVYIAGRALDVAVVVGRVADRPGARRGGRAGPGRRRAHRRPTRRSSASTPASTCTGGSAST